MIQVDVFWSFAMGACFAAMATEGIKRSDSLFVNKYFVFTVCFLSMVFAPSGIYLLWQHPSWESMFWYDRTLHGIWPLVFAHTNVLLGVLGFAVTYHMIKAGWEKQCHFLWLAAYTDMFAILTFGYDRFLYAGKSDSLDEWNAGVKYSLFSFFKGEVFFTLLLMSIFILPPIYYVMSKWPREYGLSKEQKTSLLHTTTLYYTVQTGMVLVGFNGAKILEMLPEGWGYDRMVAFLIGQFVFGCMIFGPLCLLKLKKVKA